MDYRKFYHLESYLFDEVGPRFRSTGIITPVNFFLILIWKANRAKTKVREKLRARANGNFSDAVAQIAKDLSAAKTDEDRLGVLMRDWGLRLPMATAILTVFYPKNFTVYDRRVCEILPFPYGDWPFPQCWSEYEKYRTSVRSKIDCRYSLRDKDRFLWGKSLWENASTDAHKAETVFVNLPAALERASHNVLNSGFNPVHGCSLEIGISSKALAAIRVHAKEFGSIGSVIVPS
jgi:hypothetical protein